MVLKIERAAKTFARRAPWAVKVPPLLGGGVPPVPRFYKNQTRNKYPSYKSRLKEAIQAFFQFCREEAEIRSDRRSD
ncbi:MULTISPECIES: hypothetical protein [Desulfococcus]|jgi:hypothetical protein|uniref:hypothetical protein n=1 Tax=Desulfococcus TaxID=896 RepID=UPI00040DFE2D|nr:hypothetical protein [Desulfococcus multivorans]AOY60351.1 uncharacterized protein Dmul_35820 [Desulfococcus multivorans]AQV02454.1 hypothetical protein B2D07_17900 [Desulfococcus multivorans]